MMLNATTTGDKKMANSFNVIHVERKKGYTIYTEDLGGYIRKRTVLHNPCKQSLPKPYKTNFRENINKDKNS